MEELSLAVVRCSDSQGTGFPGTVLMAEGVPCSSAPAFPGRGHAGPSLPRLPCTLGEAREEAAGAQFAQGTGGEGGVQQPDLAAQQSTRGDSFLALGSTRRESLRRQGEGLTCGRGTPVSVGPGTEGVLP